MKTICTSTINCILQDKDPTRYCSRPSRECEFKGKTNDHNKTFLDLLEAAEEMYNTLRLNKQSWKAAIDAARKEVEK